MSTHEVESAFPVLVGGVVTERHARICRERGHASHTVDGVDTGVCPRCGDHTSDPEPATPCICVGECNLTCAACWRADYICRGMQPKLCRQCHGWGSREVRYPDGTRVTEDCLPCAGSGEES